MKKFYITSLLLLLHYFANCQAYHAASIFTNYTNITPDTLLHYTYNPYTHQVCSFSIFGGAPDVEFVADGSSSPGGSSEYISIRPINPNVFVSLGRLDSVFDLTSQHWLITQVAKPLVAGDSINAAHAQWDDSLFYISDHSASFGWTKNVNDWIGSDKYVALKYDNGSSVAYGWIRLQCKTKDSCYVKEFSSTAFISSVNENKISGSRVYPNPCTSHVYVSCDNLSPNSELSVYDVCGHCVLRKKITRTEEKTDLSSQPPGVYFIRLVADGFVSTHKIIRE